MLKGRLGFGECFFSALIFIFVIFYWPSKQPESFKGITIPGYCSYVVTGIPVIYGLMLVVRDRLAFTRSQILFCVFSLATPIPGLIGYAAGAREMIEWRNHIIFDQISDNFLGFRPFLLQIVMFLFCAPVFARYWGRVMRFAVFCALGVHLIWGIAQFSYPIVPAILEKLPVMVGGDCGNGAGFCLKIVRAVGLTPNPFFFSFIYFSAAALCVNEWKGKAGYIALIISMLSISRSFIFASIIVAASRVRSKGVAIFGVVAISLYVAFGDSIVQIISSRFENDSSFGSRSSTNLLSAQEVFLNGNIFGIGFENKYFTDSTFATLMLDGGVLSVALYLCACFFLFHDWVKWAPVESKGLVRAFAIAFLVLQSLVGSADAQPGNLLFLIAFWITVLSGRKSIAVMRRTHVVED